jgi:phage gpG-like protein
LDSTGSRTRGVIWAGGSGVVYARIHEQGGVVTPKRAKALTVPLPGAMTASGVVRGDARSFSDTFLLKRKGKDPVIMQRKGKNVVPLFVLKKRVKIPKRPYLRPAIEARIPSLRSEIRKQIKMGMRK